MVRDSVQLETAVNTITHEYLLEFTSEYGISEMLRPELPGPGDRIVDFPEGKGGGFLSDGSDRKTSYYDGGAGGLFSMVVGWLHDCRRGWLGYYGGGCWVVVL
nr:hypothetical protein [Tanacetum cinerariifolium]